jgi:hypothetical protein
MNWMMLLGVLSLAGGLFLWVWTGDWRYAVSGFAGIILFAGIDAARDRRKL